MATKVKTGVIDSGAITSALITDASITADDLHTTLDLTGKTVTVATASASDNDTSVASTAYVTTAIANLADSAPSTLNTLNELAAALGDDENFSTTVTNSIATKLPLAGGTMTGALTVGTSAAKIFEVTRTGSATYDFTVTDGGDGAAQLYVNAQTNDTGFNFRPKNSSGSNIDALFIDPDGNVGIGTTSPNSHLHIKSTADVKLTLETDEDSDCWINFSGATSEASIGYEPAANELRFANAVDGVTSNVRMTITSDGRIGFGESAGVTGHRDVEGKMDLRMDMSGVNWTENDWASVWDSSGTPGTYFDKSVLHLDTNRFGGSTGGIVGIAFSPGWQGHQNWGIYSHNRSGGTSTEGDLSFVNQINAGNIQERFRLRADGLTVFPTGFSSTPRTYEKAMARGFSHNVANQKCYLVLGTEFWGQLEVSLTGTYSNQNMTGILKRSYALGLNTSGTIYNNESHTVQEEGATATNFALGEVEYDSTLGRYKIPIAHINSAGNTLEVVIKATLASSDQAYLEGMQNAYLTNVITTNTTVYKKQTRESACHVYHTGGQAITATPIALSFTSTLFDPGDCFSGSEYTAPEGGIYAFNVTYLVYPHASGVTTMSWQKYSGGGWSQYGGGIQNGPSGQSHTLHSYPTLIELSKGDKVRAMCAIGGYSGTPTVYGNQNSFTAHKV
jgi:hypothetical protein